MLLKIIGRLIWIECNINTAVSPQGFDSDDDSDHYEDFDDSDSGEGNLNGEKWVKVKN